MFNEKQLIEQCIKQNQQAQKQLFEQYSVFFINICKRYAFETSEAEDILQEGFLKILLKIDEYRGTAPLRAWMAAIIFNTAKTNYNRNKKHYHYHYDVKSIDETEIELSFNDPVFVCNELLDIIGSLPRGYKMIFELYAVQEYSHKEIAKLMGINESTSRSQYLRARKSIREKLENLSKIQVPRKKIA